eukprot:811712-Rhodomonas_salina.1
MRIHVRTRRKECTLSPPVYLPAHTVFQHKRACAASVCSDTISEAKRRLLARPRPKSRARRREQVHVASTALFRRLGARGWVRSHGHKRQHGQQQWRSTRGVASYEHRPVVCTPPGHLRPSTRASSVQRRDAVHLLSPVKGRGAPLQYVKRQGSRARRA